MGTCEQCGNELDYNDVYDVLYCANCNDWKESICSDPTCEYCISRPNTPNECDDSNNISV